MVGLLMSKKTQLMIYLDPDDLTALRELSQQTRIPMAVFVRSWIRQGLYGKDEDAWIRGVLRRLGIRVPTDLELHDREQADDLEATGSGERTLVTPADDTV